MKHFWNKRYAQQEYVYGKEPNEFFRHHLGQLPVGKLLLPAEGEGRNAVFAASLGWEVYAFDYSEEGRRKALELAAEKKVVIDYSLAHYHDALYEENTFDAVALIYAHSPQWQTDYQRMISFLKPGGRLLIEIFNKKQLANTSGGPKDALMLPDASEIKNALLDMSEINAWEETIHLDESPHHKGKAEVSRCIAVK